MPFENFWIFHILSILISRYTEYCTCVVVINIQCKKKRTGYLCMCSIFRFHTSEFLRAYNPLHFSYQWYDSMSLLDAVLKNNFEKPWANRVCVQLLGTNHLYIYKALFYSVLETKQGNYLKEWYANLEVWLNDR